MNNSRFIWGVIILALGALILASNFGYIGDNFWPSLWKFWPAVLIVWGILVLFSKKEKNNNQLGLLLSIIIILAIIAGALWQSERFGSYETRITTINEQSTKSIVNLNLKFGASELELDGNGFQAVSGQAHSFGDVNVNRQDSANATSISIDQSTRYPGHWIGKNSKNIFDLSLSQIPVYTIKVDTGASKFNLDLSKVKLEKLEINGGACSGDVKISGNVANTQLRISSGASSFNVLVPKDSYLKINDDSGLSSLDLGDLNLEKNGKEYVSKGFGSAEKRIEIQLSTGASSVKFLQY